MLSGVEDKLKSMMSKSNC